MFEKMSVGKGNEAAREGLRRAIHVASGLGAMALWWLPWLLVAAGLCAGAAVALGVRRMKWASGLHRPDEGAVSGAVWYGAGLAVCVALFPRAAAFVGWLVLAAGDAAASGVGRRWPIARLGEGRSVGGAAGFVVAGLVAVLVGLAWWHGGLTVGVAGAALGAVAAGAVAEVVTPGKFDNVTVPLCAAAGYWAIGYVMV